MSDLGKHPKAQETDEIFASCLMFFVMMLAVAGLLALAFIK